MLTRLYIDNFRCFEKFEYKPARKQLILGQNGSGKTSLMEALSSIRRLVVEGDRAEEGFPLANTTRWSSELSHTFEIDAVLGNDSYSYRLVVDRFDTSHTARVRTEIVCLNGKRVFEFDDGLVNVYADRPDQPQSYRLPLSRSALAVSVSDSSPPQSLPRLREWFAGIMCFRLDPFAMSARAERETAAPRIDLANFPEWYRHRIQAQPNEAEKLTADLREVFDGFRDLRLESVGENVSLLQAEFGAREKRVKFSFTELSEGQRCLICLYAILHFVVARGGTVIIDEPENFISLREIQPWLMAAADMADDHKGQIILISHHPELINQWAPDYGVQFVRDGAGPVRVEPFRPDAAYTLSPSELVARGWERE